MTETEKLEKQIEDQRAVIARLEADAGKLRQAAAEATGERERVRYSALADGSAQAQKQLQAARRRHLEATQDLEDQLAVIDEAKAKLADLQERLAKAKQDEAEGKLTALLPVRVEEEADELDSALAALLDVIERIPERDRECMKLAQAANLDPLEFRIRGLLQDHILESLHLFFQRGKRPQPVAPTIRRRLEAALQRRQPDQDIIRQIDEAVSRIPEEQQ